MKKHFFLSYSLSPLDLSFFIGFYCFIITILSAQERPISANVVTVQPISKIYTSFSKTQIELKDGEIISNVLKVYNNSLSNVDFRLSLTKPKFWTTLDNQNKIYIALPRDTLFIPIILIPYKLSEGNSDVIINAFLLDKDDQQIANDFFTLRTKKKVSWNVALKSDNKLYFKNGEKTKKLSYTITNTGNTKQDLFINYKSLKGELKIADTLKQAIKNPNLTLNLNADESVEFNYLISEIEQKDRNVKKVSLDNYLPNANLDYKKRSLFINTSQTKVIDKNATRKDVKVDFIKLPNLVTAEQFGYPTLPLTLELNAQNLLDDNAFMSLNLRGFKQLNNKASLAYFTQVNYNKAYFSNDPFKNATFYVGYYDDIKTIEVGQINGNILGLSSTGNGIKLSYKYLRNHKTSVFYVNNSRNSFAKSNSFGVNHIYNATENIKILASIGRNEREFLNKNTTIFSLQPSATFLKKHSISLLTAFSLRSDDLLSKNQGFLIGTTYNTHFFQKRLKVNFNSRYNDKNFSLGSFERLNFNHRSSYILNSKWSVNINNYYQKVNLFDTSTSEPLSKQEILFNTVIFNTNNRYGNLQPGLFYEYTNYPLNKLISRGASLRVSKFDFSQNFFSALNIKAGYSKPLNQDTEEKDYFTFQLSTLLRFKVWNFNVKYNYGFITSTNNFNRTNNTITPQSLRLSLQNQYAFKNRHLILESNFVYNYINIFNNHSIGIFPTLYYYTDSGWRLSLDSSYSFSTRNFSNTFADNIFNNNPNLTNINDNSASINSDLTLGFSLKKDFGIPIPFLEKEAATITISSFYDLDGDGIKNTKTESAISNVVVKIGKYEIITNQNGKAILKNIPLKKYHYKIIALEDLKGWFPNVSDSIIINADGVATIPFVRGVKIYGDIILDRQKIAIVDNKDVDLSRIKVSAYSNDKVFNTLTDKKGRFEFYLPNGQYIITMDEKVLGSTYKLARNNIPVTLKSTQDGMYVSFYVIEKRRKVIIRDFNKKN